MLEHGLPAVLCIEQLVGGNQIAEKIPLQLMCPKLISHLLVELLLFAAKCVHTPVAEDFPTFRGSE